MLQINVQSLKVAPYQGNNMEMTKEDVELCISWAKKIDETLDDLELSRTKKSDSIIVSALWGCILRLSHERDMSICSFVDMLKLYEKVYREGVERNA